MTLQDQAVEWIHSLGVVAVFELAELVRADGFRPRAGSLESLHEHYYDVQRVDDLYLSGNAESDVGVVLRVLSAMGVGSRSMRGGVRRSLVAGRYVRSVGLDAAVDAVLEHLTPLLGRWPPPDDSDLRSDRKLVELLEQLPGGVADRKTVEEFIAVEPDVDARRTSATYTPLLEMVANGVFGIRGGVLDVRAIESVRSRRRGPWAQWGRVDRNRTWVEVKTSGTGLKARLPNDCLEVLGTGRRPLVSSTGAPLGSLDLDASGTMEVEWGQRAPLDWVGAEHPAVLEFDGDDEFVRLFSGASSTAEGDPRLADGCALRHGRWGFVFEVPDWQPDTSIPVPQAVDGIPPLPVGEESDFKLGSGYITVRREPHTLRLLGLPKALDAMCGSFVRLTFAGGVCETEVSPVPSTETSLLLSSCGVFDGPAQPWRAIGAALGIGTAERKDVQRALADRERFDLAEMARAVSAKRVEQRSSIPTSCFSIENGWLVRESDAGAWTARPQAGRGLFGLVWERGRPSEEIVSSWAEQTLMLIRAWGAAAEAGGLVIQREGAQWVVGRRAGERLVDVLKTIAQDPGILHQDQVPQCGPLFSLSALGHRLVLKAGEQRLVKLTLSAEGWIGTDHLGREFGPGPVSALSGGVAGR